MITATITGRLGREPEYRTTRNGNAMVVVSVAVEVTPYGADKCVIQWFSICAFGDEAEALARHTKGDEVSATGRLSVRKWVDREGCARETWQITCDEIHSQGRRPVAGELELAL